MAAVTVTVAVEDEATDPVDGVLVQVYDAAGTVFLTEGLTGDPTPGTGIVEFTLTGDGPGISYTIRMSKDGLYFPGGATQTISVTDPPAPNNDFGPYASAVGPSAQLVVLAVEDEDANPIEDVALRVYDLGDTFLTEGLTDVNGELEVFLDGAADPGTSYAVHLRKDGVIFPDPVQAIAVLDPLVPPNTNTFDFAGTVYSPSVSLDANLCRVYGTFTDVSGNPAKNLRLEFKPCPNFPASGDGAVRMSSRLLGTYYGNPTLLAGKILTRSVKVDTDANGFFQVDLPREGFFDVHVHGFEEPIEITERIYVPDAASAAFTDLLFPYVTAVTYASDPIAVSEGETVTVEFTLTLSNTQEISDVTEVQDLITFSSGDEDVAGVTLSSENEIEVQGIAAGSTTVEVERVESAVVPSRPALAALVVTPPTVNVT